MQIDRRKVHLEPIPIQPQSSFAVRHFQQESFPFLWHYHPESELTLVVRGSGLRFVGNAIESYDAGDLCLLGSNLPHSWQSAPASGAVHSVVAQFREDSWGPFLNLPELKSIRLLLKEVASKGICISGDTAAKVSRMMLVMGNEDPGSVRQLLLLVEALSAISEHPQDQRLISSESTAHTVDDPGASAINRAIAILNESIGDVLPAQSEIAARLSMSPSTFSRLFRRCVGKNYMDYLNEWRVGLACRALLETDDSIVDVSLAAGFENLSNFHRRFRDQKGVTPTQWRASARTAQGTSNANRRTRGPTG